MGINKEDLIKMELHQELRVNDLTYVLRVVGGWIYEFFDPVSDTVSATTFVPEIKGVN